MAIPGAVFLYAWLVVEPPLRYEGAAPVFLWDAQFLRRFLEPPGGLVKGVAALGAQGDAFPLLGAAMFTALVTGIVWLLVCRPSLAPGQGASVGVWPWIPAVPLVALYGIYSAPVLEVAWGGFLALVVLQAWERLSPIPLLGRAMLFWGLAVGLGYAAGAPALLLFVLTGSVIEGLQRRSIAGGVACLAAVGLIPLSVMTGLVVNPAELWAPLGRGLGLSLGLAFVGLSGTAVLWRVLRPLARLPHRVWGRLEIGAGATLGAASLALIWLTLDRPQRTRLEIQYEAEHGRWDRVLEAAAGLSDYPAGVRLRVHRALLQTGRLCDELFAFPQRRGDDLLPALGVGLDVAVPLSDVLLDLGFVNLAERYAHEALEIQGERPSVLLRLARIQVLKQRPAAARVFLHRLRLVPFHRARADGYLHALEADPAWSADPDMARWRAARVNLDLAEFQFTTAGLLEGAVQSPSAHRMLLEYWVALGLLNFDLEKVVRAIPRFQALGVAELPRHIEEAFLLVQHGRPDRAPSLEPFRIRETTRARFQRWLEWTKRERPPEPHDSFAASFGDTLWFYGQFAATHATKR